MFAAGINVSASTLSISCNIATATGSTLTGNIRTLTVTLPSPGPSASAPVTIGVATASGAGAPSALTVVPAVNGALGNVLGSATVANTSTIYSTGVVFNVNAQQYCANAANVGTNTLTFNFTGTPGTLTSASVTVTLTVTGVLTQANLPNSTTVNLNCATANGPGAALTALAQTINVQLATPPPTGTSIAMAAGTYTTSAGSVTQANSPLVVTVPATALTPSNYNQGINVTINAQPYCANATVGTTTPTFNLTGTVSTPGVGAMTGVTVTTQTITVNLVVSASASPLTVSPSSVSINCIWDGNANLSANYTPGAAQTVSVTGPTGLNFTLGSTPGWVTLSPSSFTSIAASATAYNFTVAAAAGCGLPGANGATKGTIHLTNGLNLDKVINVTLNVVSASLLTATPVNNTTLAYVKGSGTPGHIDINVHDISGNTPYAFTVDTTSLGPWLNVDTTTAMTPATVRFTSTSIVDSLAPGSYSQKVRVQTASYGDLIVTIPIMISNPASTLTVTGTATAGCSVSGLTQTCTAMTGQAPPSASITLKSSDAPISYSIATSGALAPIVAQDLLGGLAYNFGTTIPVTFSPSVFFGVGPGTVLTGTVVITAGVPATNYVVTFNITVQAPGAILTGISPTIVPTMASGQQVQIVLVGSGFIQSASATQATTVGIVNSSTGVFTTDNNIVVNILNASNILLTITASSTDTAMNFGTATTFPVTIGVCNPNGSTCTTATGTSIFTIGASPNIQTVTSASAYLQPAGAPPVAPYDVVSIFGTNLCSSCVGANATMYGSPQTSNLVYQNSLSNTDANSVTRKLQVAFLTHVSTTTPLTSTGPTITTVYAPLLFATNNQINLLVPSAVSSAITSGNHLVDVQVSFGTTASPALSNLFPVLVVSSDPGIFTIGADGQGNAAILDKTWAVVGQNNPAAMHATPITDQFAIYMTGLGAPASSADISATNGSYRWSTDCVALTGANSYQSALNNQTGINPATLDGLVLQSSLLNSGSMVPCLVSSGGSSQAPTSVTVGGVAATVKYAGWVGDSVAGLYQVNVTLPSNVGTFYTTTADCKNFTGSFSNITAPVQLPVCYTSHDTTTVSQPGVMVWVAPRLTVTAPGAASGSPLTLTEKVGNAFTASLGASEGSGSGYTYTLASGTLPAGVSLSAGGVLSGTPALGTVGPYPIVVQATDTSVVPLTGTVSFTLAVNNGLFVSSSVLATGVSVATGPATTWSGAITQVGGTPTITYTVQSANLPAGLTLNPDGTVTGTATNPADHVVVVFQATDANGWSGTVSVTFIIT